LRSTEGSRCLVGLDCSRRCSGEPDLARTAGLRSPASGHCQSLARRPIAPCSLSAVCAGFELAAAADGGWFSIVLE
jgi:hypothetical protein